MSVQVDALLEHDGWAGIGLEALAERAAVATARQLELPEAEWELVVLGCGDARIAELNAAFRGRDGPTNVLSWPSEERGADRPGGSPWPPDPSDPELGDIALAFETCQREAEAAGRDIRDHALHLVVHALLHLLGYEHETDADAALMEGLEVRILASLGLSDPYR